MSNLLNGIVQNETQAQIQTNSEFKSSIYWINVGIRLGNGTFVSLPMGIPLDSMKGAKGNSELSQLKNKLLEVVKSKANQLNAGEAAYLNLAVQVYKRSDEAAPTDLTSEFNQIINQI